MKFAAALLALGLVVTGCSSDGHDGAEEAVSPLTGRVNDLPTRSHPVYVVKVDNAPAARPQVGLNAADLIFEEVVEGGLTRFAAFYYSTLPKQVGPVRSLRTSDAAIAAPAQGVLVTSGFSPQAWRRIKGAALRVHGPEKRGTARVSGRPAPHNLMANLRQVNKAYERGDQVPAYLPWGEELPTGKPVKSVDVRLTPSQSARWQSSDNGFVRKSGGAEGAKAATVVVLRVKIKSAGYTDSVGSFVPETVLMGSGKAQIFHDGRLVNARWTKKSEGAALKFSKNGESLGIPPGKAWVELVPTKGSVTVK